MFLILGLGFRCLQRGDVLADAQDDEIGFEARGVGELPGDVVPDVVAFEVGDVLDHDLGRRALFGRERLGHEMNIILIL